MIVSERVYKLVADNIHEIYDFFEWCNDMGVIEQLGWNQGELDTILFIKWDNKDAEALFKVTWL